MEDVYGGTKMYNLDDLISTDRSGGPLSRSGRGAVLVNYGLNDSNTVCINGAARQPVEAVLINR